MIARYSVEVAKRYGINAAIVAAKLEFLQARTPRKDGYCWRMQEELYNETGLTPRMQRLAITILCDAGLLEVKNTMIIGTKLKCRHFKLTPKYYREVCCLGDRDEEPVAYPGFGDDGADDGVNNGVNSTHKTEIDENLWVRFWTAYPKHINRERVRQLFIKLNPTAADVDVWVDAIEEQKRSKQWSDPQFIPSPATWLSGRRWEDELEPPETGGSIEYQHEADDLAFFK